jgi:hypothetical protein
MPIIQFLADNPPLSALLALTIIGFTISYGAAFALGRIGVEIGFVLNVSPLMRRIFAILIGGVIGLLIGGIAGAMVGLRYGLGPDHVLLGMMSFLGLTTGTFLGGIKRELATEYDMEFDQEIPKDDNVVQERIRWLVWHYTSLELGQAISLMIAIVIGMVWGMATAIFFAASDGTSTRILYALMGALAGAILGGAGALLANPQGKVSVVVIGMVLGLVLGCAIGVLMIEIARLNLNYTWIPGMVYGGLGGFCFGMLGGDPVHAKPVE